MIRVLWLIKGLGAGGAEQLLVSAAAVRDRSVFDVEAAYVLAAKDALVPQLEAEGVAVHALGAGDARDPRWMGRLRRLLVDGRFDVVHAHLPLAAAGARLVCRTLPARLRPAVVTTEHNAWSTYALATRLANAMTAPLDQATIAVSEEARDSMWWRGARRRCEVVVHGVAVERVRAHLGDRDAVRAELGVAAADVLVATVANFRAQKAYPDLLAAAGEVLDGGAPARFLAVGQGPLESEVRALHAELGLGDRFTILGYRPDAARLLAGADVFALASRYEGYPVALMEAMALGLPVVATAVGGVRQAVTDGVEGLLVPPGRPDLLAAAVARLVADPGLRSTMAVAAERRGAHFDITGAVRRVEAVYRRVGGSE